MFLTSNKESKQNRQLIQKAVLMLSEVSSLSIGQAYQIGE